ncbi:MAG: hypothetical protein ABI045_05055 [Flavobacteriales bacterium]
MYHTRIPQRLHTYQSEFDVNELKYLPKVGIIYGHAHASLAPVKALMDEKFEGIVHAGVGNGYIYK